MRDQGTGILLACHDIDQMFRLADRIVVLRHGRVVADLRPSEVHPDDVVALLSGQQVGSSARRQLTRLHGLADDLVSADPSSSLSLILSALGAALGSERLCIHLLEGDTLACAASLGLPAGAAGRVGAAAVRDGGRPGRAGRAGPGAGDRGQRRPPAWPGRRSGTWPGRAKVGRVLVGARARPRRPGRRHHRAARRPPGGRSATTWTWSPCTPATRPARSSGTGCWTRSPAATGSWRRSARCWRRWPGRCRWPTGWASPCSRCAAACEAAEVALVTQAPGGAARCRAVAGAPRAAPCPGGWRSPAASLLDAAARALGGAAPRRRGHQPGPRAGPGPARPAAADRDLRRAGQRGRRWWPAGPTARRPPTPRRCWRTPPTRCAWPWSARRPGSPTRRRSRCAAPGSCSAGSCPGSATSCAPR